MKHILLIVMAFFAMSGTALGQKNQGQENIRKQQEQAATAAAAGQLFVEEFAQPLSCPKGYEEVYGEYSQRTVTSSDYSDNPRRQNRRHVREPNAFGSGLFYEGPSNRYRSRSRARSEVQCIRSPEP